MNDIGGKMKYKNKIANAKKDMEQRSKWINSFQWWNSFQNE